MHLYGDKTNREANALALQAFVRLATHGAADQAVLSVREHPLFTVHGPLLIKPRGEALAHHLRVRPHQARLSHLASAVLRYAIVSNRPKSGQSNSSNQPHRFTR